MRLVIADTSPLRYLVQINQIELLPRLFEKVFIPSVVCGGSPFRAGGGAKLDYIETRLARGISGRRKPRSIVGPVGRRREVGHCPRDVSNLGANLIIIDDRRGAAVARAKGFEVTGALGILDLAARRGAVDLADALARLRTTNFRRREELFDALLKQHMAR